MTFRIDGPLPPAPRPIYIPPPIIAPVKPAGETLHEFIPGAVPFADFLKRQNFIARFTEPTWALWPATRRGEGRDSACPRAGSNLGAEPGRLGWPRLGDVSPVRTTIEHALRVVYRIERLVPVGTRIDLVG
jgi:hypothetical protein